MDLRTISLMDVGLLAASLGPAGAIVLAGVGLLLAVLGARAFRFASALLATCVGAAGVSWAASVWASSLPTSSTVAVVAAALTSYAVGLALPGAAAVLVSAAFGALAAAAFAPSLPAYEAEVIAAGAVAGALLAAMVFRRLDALVTPLVASAAIVLGAWGWTGASGARPLLFRTPLLWVAAAVVLWVVLAAFERGRIAGRSAKAARLKTAAEAADRKRHDEELMQRWEREGA